MKPGSLVVTKRDRHDDVRMYADITLDDWDGYLQPYEIALVITTFKTFWKQLVLQVTLRGGMYFIFADDVIELD